MNFKKIELAGFKSFADKIEIAKTYDNLVVGYSKLWEKLSQDIAEHLIQK